MIVGAETDNMYAAGDAVGEGDPGYLSTSRMCSQTALSLVQTRKTTKREGGVLTPALAVGEILENRLLD